MNFDEIYKNINSSAESLYETLTASENGIPKINSSKGEISDNKHIYHSKFFFIAEQEGANEFADFMTNIINNPNTFAIVRENENWTPNGELIKIIEFLEKKE